MFSAGEDWTRLFLTLEGPANTALLADHTVVVSLTMSDGVQDREWFHEALSNPELGVTHEWALNTPSLQAGVVGEISISITQFASSPLLEEAVAVLGKPRR